jgi:hypothetical protein
MAMIGGGSLRGRDDDISDETFDNILNLLKNSVGDQKPEIKERKLFSNQHYTYGDNHITLEETETNKFMVSWKLKNQKPDYRIIADKKEANDLLEAKLNEATGNKNAWVL